ncbi:cupin domain-containing protein [Variovorax sp. KK3]|uniref:cupin domain-containing protein n=1 Tax=Variovorax sp. KK3 TaxID=1855728 RepID=UPI00097C9D57|nr:cupin domain-containing protein [Variovorax sp. KK3]
MTETTQFANLYDMPRETVRRGVERAGFRGKDFIAVMNWLTPGMDLAPHKHEFEQVAIILQGQVRFHVGDEVFEAGPGGSIRIPAGVMHHAEPVGTEVVLNLDIFSPVRPDYLHLVAGQDGDASKP